MAISSAKQSKSGRPAASCSVPDGEPVPVIKGSHVYLIDGSGYIFRAFHALPPLTRPSDGLPVGMQIIGAAFDEARILGIGAALEDAGVGIPACPMST